MIEEWTARPCFNKPTHLTGGCNDYTSADIEWIASQFNVSGPFTISPFPGRGNINLHTYQVTAGGSEFLLQKVNSDVFTMPYRVMLSMMASLKAQRDALAEGKGDELWTPIELVETKEGQPFLDLTDDHGWSVWRLMVRIQTSDCYKSLSEVDDRATQLRLAEEVGRGLAIYSDLTSSIDPDSIEGSLPGYRDTGLYYRQLHSVLDRNRTFADARDLLPADPILRASTENHFLLALTDQAFERRRMDPELKPFIETVLMQERFAMRLWSAVEDASIRNTLIHGDTKIENFLFCSESGRVKALVDMDTIMPFTWLADWGDLQRSMVNVAGEKELDLSKVAVDEAVYAAVAKGFLETAREITDAEVELMTIAVEAIALELGVRFLTDYLRGDTYFQLAPGDPKDLNKVRAMVQLTLFERLREFAPRAKEIVAAARGCRVTL